MTSWWRSARGSARSPSDSCRRWPMCTRSRSTRRSLAAAAADRGDARARGCRPADRARPGRAGPHRGPSSTPRRPRWWRTCPTTWRCRWCCTCSPSCRRCVRGLVMVQQEVARPAHRAAGVQSVRSAEREAGLVRLGAARRAGCRPACSGRCRGWSPAWSRSPAGRRPSIEVSRADVFAVIDAAFAQRRKMLRSALVDWAGGPAAADGDPRAGRRRADGPG